MELISLSVSFLLLCKISMAELSTNYCLLKFWESLNEDDISIKII